MLTERKNNMAKVTLTKEQLEKYLKNSNECPVCDSGDIEGGRVEIDDSIAWQNMTCNDCGLQWTDLYTLKGIDADNVFDKDGCP